MKISIIIAVYNGGKTLQTCIDSISAQTYKNTELVIMDGGSNDSTVAVLEKNSELIDFWETKKDRGIAHAWNKALKRITGKWIIFLGADDYLYDKNVLSDAVIFLNNSNAYDVVYGQIVFEGGQYNGQAFGNICNLKQLKRKMILPHTSAFHSINLFNETAGFDESFKIAMDYDLLLRKKNLSVRFLDRRIAVMGGEGISSKMIFQTLREFRVAQIKSRVTWRVEIEAWHAYYNFRHLLKVTLTEVKIWKHIFKKI